MTHKKVLLTIMYAVLTILVGTAYMHVKTDPVFAETTSSETEIFVVFEDQQNSEEAVDLALDALADDVDVESAEEVVDAVADDGAGILITVTDGANLGEAIDALNDTEGVAYAQPNYHYQMMEKAQESSVSVNDAYRKDQYYLDPWNPSFETNCGAGVTNAWELLGGINTGGTGNEVVIAVLDSGCQTTHHDLAANIDTTYAYDAVNQKQGAGYVKDSSGHGTHVCGIAAGVANNTDGIAGVSGNYAKVIPVNVFSGQYADTADMVTAFRYLEDLMDTGKVKNLHVINMSLGGYNGPDENDIALESYINRMRSKDVLTVCAGGNGDEKTGKAYKDKPVYPGDFDGCLCVTSLEQNGTNSEFSDYNQAKDISAPGAWIISTITDERDSNSAPDEGYAYLSGTSMASPLVAGVAALIWADNDQLTADQVYESIVATAAEVNPAVNDHRGETGSAGAIDAAAAIGYARDHFDTKRTSLAEGTMTVDGQGMVFDGEEKHPAVTVTCGGKTLTEGKEYVLSYMNCIYPGKAQVTATGIRDYIGQISAEYTIAKADLAKAAVVLEPSAFAYDGEYHFPEITVTMNGMELIWGQDYTPTGLTNGIDSGTHQIKLTGKGYYDGSKIVTYKIGTAAAKSSKNGNVKKPAATKAVAPVKVNTTFKAGQFTYRVTTVKGTAQVKLTKSAARGKVSIPKTVKYRNRTYAVSGIGTEAFKGSAITALTVTANVKTIDARAFAGCKKLKKITIQTKQLTKAGVKGSLKGSKVKTIKVKVGSKKENKKFKKKYKKIFKKKICGKKVKVK